MNGIPFMRLTPGALFRALGLGPLLMKLNSGNQAVALESCWVKDSRDNVTLIKRGDVSSFSGTDFVVPESEPRFTLSTEQETPKNPHLLKWAEGDIHWVGLDLSYPVPVFAGMFVCSGFLNSGEYYAVTGEKTVMDSEAARARAQAEDVPFVFIYKDNACPPGVLAALKGSALKQFNEGKAATTTTV